MSPLRPIFFLIAAIVVIGLIAARSERPVAKAAVPPKKREPAMALTPAMKDGQVIFQTVCATCHGPKGEGKNELKSPAIAALPDWYAKHQIAGFREGRRGHNAQDTQSFLMGTMAKSLSPEQITAVVDHLSRLPRTYPADAAVPASEEALAEGQLAFQERCMECHRYNASGEMAFGSPPLIGQQAWYIKEQIHQFKTGRRGTIKGDVNGSKMVLSSSFIEDEKMLDDIVTYILSLNPKPEPALENSSPFESAAR
jgi:cbb3-type cytochrome c oxidase subunit III